MAKQTFVFADLAGYTALTEAHGDEYAADVAADFCAAMRSMLGGYAAEEVKAVGDALLVRFTDAAEAVRFARRVISELGAGHRTLGVRIGIHTGTAVRREGDWYGTGVNLAARVSDLARAGEVTLTGPARRAARLAPAETGLRGSHHLKNVLHPIEVYVLAGEKIDGSRLPLDPVCRMAVDPQLAPRQTLHEGVEYVFCSDTCADAFVADPGQFTRHLSPQDDQLASIAARERTARRIARAYGRGHLTSAEMETRLERAWRARTRAELKSITYDLSRFRRSARWLRGRRPSRPA